MVAYVLSCFHHDNGEPRTCQTIERYCSQMFSYSSCLPYEAHRMLASLPPRGSFEDGYLTNLPNISSFVAVFSISNFQTRTSFVSFDLSLDSLCKLWPLGIHVHLLLGSIYSLLIF